jgi:multidrug efflux system membrane fusion protein
VSKAEITLGNLVDASSVLTSVVSLDRIYASFDGDEDTYLRVRPQAHAASR